MSSQINAVFKAMKENLQDTTIETSLEVSSIIAEFDIAQELKEDKTPGVLKNVALGKFMDSQSYDLILICCKVLPPFPRSSDSPWLHQLDQSLPECSH